MSDKLTKLEPCPFCDSADYRTGCGTVRPHKRRARSLGPDRYHFYIQCGSCNFDGPQGLSEQQAIDGWNRRTLTPLQSSGTGKEG